MEMKLLDSFQLSVRADISVQNLFNKYLTILNNFQITVDLEPEDSQEFLRKLRKSSLFHAFQVVKRY